MRDVLKEYDDAVREKGSEIRNLVAYLFGVVKRYKSLHECAMTGDDTAITLIIVTKIKHPQFGSNCPQLHSQGGQYTSYLNFGWLKM